MMQVLGTLLIVSASCFAVIVGGTMLGAAYQVLQYARGARSGLDWWLVASAAGTLMSGVVVAATYLDVGANLLSLGTAAPRATISAYIGLVIAFATLPLGFLILRAYARHGVGVFAYAYTVVAVTALPVAMFFSLVVASIGYVFVAAPSLPLPKHLEISDAVRPLFEVDAREPACTSFLRTATGLPLFDRSNITYAGTQSLEVVFLYALDTTFDSLLLGIPGDAGCALTLVRHNPDSMVATIVYLAFKTFISLVAVSVLSLPFQQLLRRRDTSHAA